MLQFFQYLLRLARYSAIHDFSANNHQGDSKRWTQRVCTSCWLYDLNSKRSLNTRQTVG